MGYIGIYSQIIKTGKREALEVCTKERQRVEALIKKEVLN